MLLQPLGVYGLVELYPFSVAPIAFFDQIRSGGAAVVWMVEFEPYLGTAQVVQLRTMAGPGLGPLGVVGFGEEYFLPIYRAAAAPIERHSSMPDGINTTSTDTPANVSISNRLVQDRIQVRRNLPQEYQRFAGFVAETAGQIVLNGADGSLDRLFDASRVIRDRPIRIKSAAVARLDNGRLAKPSASAFNTAFAGRIVNGKISPDGLVELTVTDGWKRLDRPIQERLYLGTGGREGGVELTGQPVPLCYGVCPNITPVLLDRINGIYQVHDGEALDMVPRDMGVPLTVVGGVDTFEDLLALTTVGEVDFPDIDLGTAWLCRQEGMFRIAGGVNITCDVEGDGLYDGPVTFRNGVLFKNGVGWKAPGSRTYRRYPAGMIYRILVSRGRVQDAEIDLDQMLQTDLNYPYEMGIFISSNERPTVREVCTRIADSAGAVVPRNKFGQITLQMLTGASPGSPVVITDNILAQPVEQLSLPWGAPWPALKLSYAPNWTPLSEDKVSLEVEDAARALLMQKSSVVEVGHAEMGPLLPDREPLEISTILRSATDAKAVASRVIDFYAGKWALYRVVIRGVGFRLDVLSTVILAVSRFGFSAGVPMLVVGLEERPGDYETELTLM